MIRKSFDAEAPKLYLSTEQFEALPQGRPADLDTSRIGRRWLERCWGGVRVREWRGYTHDGRLVETYRPVIRVKAISRLVPRPQVAA